MPVTERRRKRANNGKSYEEKMTKKGKCCAGSPIPLIKSTPLRHGLHHHVVLRWALDHAGRSPSALKSTFVLAPVLESLPVGRANSRSHMALAGNIKLFLHFEAAFDAHFLRRTERRVLFPVRRNEDKNQDGSNQEVMQKSHFSATDGFLLK